MGVWKFLGGKIWQEDHFEINKEFVRFIETEEDKTWLLTDEDLLLPGVIDFHAHLWNPSALSPYGISPDSLYAEGIVGVLDAGSVGCRDWPTAQHYWKGCRTDVHSCCHLLPEGFAIFPPKDPTKPENMDAADIASTIDKMADESLYGIKIHLGFLPYKSIETDRATIQLARRVADITGKKLNVHMSGICMPVEEMVEYLREGDILTHVYTGFEHPIADGAGKVYPAVWNAKNRGVIMDIAHCAKHFSWDLFRKVCLEQSFMFDTISSDLTVFTYKKTDTSTLYDLYHVISAMICAGVDINTAFKAVTTTPSKILNIPLDMKKYTLLLRKTSSKMPLNDGLGKSLYMESEYKPQIFCDEKGCVLYREKV